jgi:hypothetical protein
VKPHELRKKYTEYVLENKDLAMCAKPLNRTNGLKESIEEYKSDSVNNSRFSERQNSKKGSQKGPHLRRRK